MASPEENSHPEVQAHGTAGPDTHGGAPWGSRGSPGGWHLRAVRFGQLLHLMLLVAIGACYAALKATLPVDDPDRTRIDLMVSVVVAVWAGLTFVELLRGEPKGSLVERSLNAYRRVLRRPLTLLAADVLFGLACTYLVILLVLYRSVEIYSVADLRVYQDDPGTASRFVGTVKATSTTRVRLRVGSRFLAFKRVGRTGTAREIAVYSKLVHVAPPWREMKLVTVPEIPPYDDLQ